MNNHEAAVPTQPEWFADAANWWSNAFPSPATAACFRPLGVDAQGQLHVRCRNHAYATLLRQIRVSVFSRIHSSVPHAQPTGLLPEQRPTVRILVVANEDFTDHQLLEDVLLEMWHDVTQVVGTEHEILLQLTGETAFDRQVSAWAAAQVATMPDVNEPFSVAVYQDGDVSARDQMLIDADPALCLALCSSEVTFPSPARLALATGIPVRRAAR